MPTPRIDQLGYLVSQSARFGWFYSQYILARRRYGTPAPDVDLPEGLPDRTTLLTDLFELFQRDYENVRHGLYPPPHDMWPRPDRVLRTSRSFFRDLCAVQRRRQEQGHQEVFEGRLGARGYPRYYLQNFHYQTDGYLSEESASLYDYQVEVLFSGGADAMRRQLVVPMRRYLRGRNPKSTLLLDLACGTGRFLRFARDAHPTLRLAGLDLSPHYLGQAHRILQPARSATLMRANAEAVPVADASVDLVSVIFLFHELPRQARQRVASEVARVLKPGGLLLFLDSLQRGDEPKYDPLLELFPRRYHEPYYDDYTRADLTALLADLGLVPVCKQNVFLAKCAVFRRSLPL